MRGPWPRLENSDSPDSSRRIAISRRSLNGALRDSSWPRLTRGLARERSRSAPDHGPPRQGNGRCNLAVRTPHRATPSRVDGGPSALLTDHGPGPRGLSGGPGSLGGGGTPRSIGGCGGRPFRARRTSTTATTAAAAAPPTIPPTTRIGRPRIVGVGARVITNPATIFANAAGRTSCSDVVPVMITFHSRAWAWLTIRRTSWKIGWAL